MSWLYFVGAGGSSPVKIGITTNIDSRLSSIQNGNPFRLRYEAVIPGDRELEEALHEALAPFRMQGEWFRRVPRLRHALRFATDFGEQLEQERHRVTLLALARYGQLFHRSRQFVGVVTWGGTL